MPEQKKSVTWRSLLLGTLAALAVCALTPLNDLILSNTSLSAGFLPLGAVLILTGNLLNLKGPAPVPVRAGT